MYRPQTEQSVPLPFAEMVPANPFNAEIVMVEVPEMHVMRARVDGLAETMKSTTVNVAVVL